TRKGPSLAGRGRGRGRQPDGADGGGAVWWDREVGGQIGVSSSANRGGIPSAGHKEGSAGAGRRCAAESRRRRGPSALPRGAPGREGAGTLPATLISGHPNQRRGGQDGPSPAGHRHRRSLRRVGATR